MFKLIKQMFITLLSFSGSLATKYVSLNNEPCMIRYTLIDLNPDISVPNKTKDLNIKVFNMIKKINEVKTLIKHISRDYKCRFISTTCNSNQNLIM